MQCLMRHYSSVGSIYLRYALFQKKRFFIFYCVPIHIPLYIDLSKTCRLNFFHSLFGHHNLRNSFLLLYVIHMLLNLSPFSQRNDSKKTVSRAYNVQISCNAKQGSIIQIYDLQQRRKSSIFQNNSVNKKRIYRICKTDIIYILRWQKT